jgi:CRISPR-associated protein Csm2
MKFEQALKNATPLEKARAFSLLGQPDFRRNSIDERYVNTVKELLDEYKLTAYQDAILNDLQNFKGVSRDWQKSLNPVKKQYEGELINKSIIEAMDTYISLDQVNTSVLIEWAETLAAYLVGVGLKTSQIRKFLDGVRKLDVNVKNAAPEEFNSNDVIFLKVHLAYAKARQEEVKPLMLVMNNAINKIRSEGLDGFRDFKQFIKFVEAVVAYHKYYGGND